VVSELAQPATAELDLLETAEAVAAVLAGQAQVPALVAGSQAQLTRAVEALVAAYSAGGRILLLGAGTSGRLAVQEAAEVPGTYGIPAERIQARVAGGGPDQLVGTDAAEDDEAQGRADVGDLAIRSGDALIAVAASGRTPYTRAAAELARERGAVIITVTNVVGSPLAALADVAIEVPVGHEVVAGSTRLAAGTAQKLVLNTLTTTTMIRLGHVHRHHMVDVVAANDKLRARICDVVAESSGCVDSDAWQALERCDWNARAAIVHLVTGLSPAAAASRAAAHRTVREAIAPAG
jgi:N-acetylmuramic acid 6-phosphate etherase